MRKLLLFLVAVLLAYQSDAACNAGFTYSAGTSAPLFYSFVNTSTWSTTGGVIGHPQYIMDFGDGSGLSYPSVYNANFYHSYTTPGTYTAKLILTVRDTVTSNLYCSDTSIHTIVVSAPPCYSTITKSFSQNTGTFTANNTSGGSPTFTWYFGDGTSATGSPVTHTFSHIGPIYVSLVTSAATCVDSAVTVVYPLTCNGVHAQFSASPYNLQATFYNQCVGDFGTNSRSYLWNFGDGTTSTSNNPYHAYASAGTYTVQLFYTVTDSATGFSCTDSISHQVTISGPSCANNHASFGYSYNGLTATFYNYSNGSGTPTYHWYFGDGTSSTTTNPIHTYATAGNYSVLLFTEWNMSGIICRDSAYYTITLSSGSACYNHYANMYYYASGTNGYQFYNNSPTFPGQTNASLWIFGDGTTSTTLNPTHIYSAPGNYNVVLVNKWIDSANNVVCIDSAYSTLNVANLIQGYIHVDSTTMTTPDTFKVWLIQNDSVNNTLTAVDSQIVSGYWWINYQFNNEPAGVYFTKAQLLGQANGSNGYVPTYHDSSIYWSQATPIYHSGATSISNDIYMRHGIVTSGPGFIGGSITAGANKGTGTTGAGVPGIIVYLRDNFGQLVQSAFTDANGNFSFSNVPLGSYSLYPEDMNYLTTPIGGIQITAANSSLSGFNFGQTATEIRPKSTGVENIGKENFSLYPNPANNKVQIQWNETSGTASITITDVAGRKVYQSENVKMSGATEVNTSAMQPGLYFIRIASENNQHTIKLLIQH